MKIASREVPVHLIPAKIVALAKSAFAARKLRRPVAMIRHYLSRTSPERVEFRDGLTLTLSSHPHDLLSVFGVFFRRDYGTVRQGEVVVDVGANIGTFAIHAARCGAARVYAFEPSREAYETMCKSVLDNGLEKVVIPLNFAVSGQSGEARFPKSSSPYNSIVHDAGEDVAEYETVQTVTLSEIIQAHGIESIDVLKLDCEGAEFDIFDSMDEAVSEKIREIRMEYHRDPGAVRTRAALDRIGFEILPNAAVPGTVTLWAARVSKGRVSEPPVRAVVSRAATARSTRRPACRV